MLFIFIPAVLQTIFGLNWKNHSSKITDLENQ